MHRFFWLGLSNTVETGHDVSMEWWSAEGEYEQSRFNV